MPGIHDLVTQLGRAGGQLGRDNGNLCRLCGLIIVIAGVLRRLVGGRDLGQGFLQVQGYALLHSGHAAIGVWADGRRDLAEVDEIPHERAFKRRVDWRGRVAVGIWEVAPAVEMDGNVHGLAGIGHEMAPIAEVADDELLAQGQMKKKVLAVRCLPGRTQPRLEGAPHAEILTQLLEAIEHLIGKVSPGILSLHRRRTALRGIEGFARRRQVCQRHHAADDNASVVDVDEVARVALRIVHRARCEYAAGTADAGDDTGSL